MAVKSSLAMRRNFQCMVVLTRTIAVYGMTPTQTKFTRLQNIHKKLLFGVDFLPAASLMRNFMKVFLVKGFRFRY